MHKLCCISNVMHSGIAAIVLELTFEMMISSRTLEVIRRILLTVQFVIASVYQFAL